MKTFDLTRSQTLLWTGQQLHPNSPLYNMAFCFEYSVAINVPKFQQAFQQLVAHSDAMRTVFGIENGLPQQYVLGEMEVEMEILDWSHRQEEHQNVKTWAEARTAQNFDLSERLFDSALIKINETQYIWYLNQHHLITDAWSFTVQYQAMMSYYLELLENKNASFTELPQFESYIAHEKKKRNDPKHAHVAQDWLDKLADFPLPPKLYGYDDDYSTTSAKRVQLTLGKDRSDQLRALAQQSPFRSWTVHSSLFNLFVTLYAIYLFRISGQQKIAIGTPAHNRSTKDFKNTPGVFIELFPVAIDIGSEETFVSLYKKVQIEVNQFLRNAQTGTSSAALSKSFNTILNYIHAGFKSPDELPMQSTWVHSGHADAQHHIRMQVYDFDQNGEIEVHFDLNQAVFEGELEKDAPQHFLKLVDSLLDDAEQLIESIPLTTEEEAKQLVEEYNSTQMDFTYHSVVDAFETQLRATPQQIAIRYNEQLIDYQTLNRKANQVAHFLQSKNIGKGDRVALHFKRTPELLYAIWGVLKSGATYIPVPSNTPKKRVLDLMEEAEVSCLLTSEKLQSRLGSSDERIIVLGDQIKDFSTENLEVKIEAADLAYIMFTSGSTGRPKGVMISHGALANYIQWADSYYKIVGTRRFPLFTMIGFDLTVTSLFLPLVTGGELHIYEEADSGPDLALMEVVEDNAVNCIKLTPSHLNLLRDKDLETSQLQLMIVGGEDFKTELAKPIQQQIGGQLKFYNEYGPTEATVGCIVYDYQWKKDEPRTSVPIGKPIANMQAYILDKYLNVVPRGVVGDLYLSGEGLAKGYWKRVDLTAEKFVDHLFVEGEKIYKSGDLARWNEEGVMEFLGRADEQIKIGGIRVEPGEIEHVLKSHPSIESGVLDLKRQSKKLVVSSVQHCTRCGLPSNYPNITFDEEGVCNFCHSFDTFEQKVQQYFKDKNDLKLIFQESQTHKTGDYDCMMLLSGGKDSTYALGQLVEMGYKVLAFTLDNGYISEEALDNVRRVTKELGVDCIFGSTPAMNDIFVDSLQRHCNVCQGCFKTIYTLSMKIALEKGIPIIVTGLSRGQFFETRLTEELFWSDRVDIDKIDQIILNARKEYHRVDDAVKRLLDTSVFEDDETFEKVQFVDYYRFTDVSLEEMYEYLDARLPWIRPSDTGRSTNCLINKLGIFVHTKQQGYSNYAFPYSYDVRMGHKKRATAIDEINEPIDEPEVRQMMSEIGYQEPPDVDQKEELIAFYVAPHVIAESELRSFMSQQLPDYMIPSRFVHFTELPLTANGKVDRKQLFAALERGENELTTEYVAPSTEFEELVAGVWQEVLELEQIGVDDDFISLGGTSLDAIRINARLVKTLELELPLNLIFEQPTIAQYAAHLESMIEQLLSEMEEA